MIYETMSSLTYFSLYSYEYFDFRYFDASYLTNTVYKQKIAPKDQISCFLKNQLDIAGLMFWGF